MSVTIGTSTASTATEYYAQRKICKSSTGTLILIAQLGAVSPGGYAFKTSTDNGVNWSAWTQITSTVAYDIDAYLDSNDDILLAFTNASGNAYFHRLTWTDSTWTVGSNVYISLGSATKPVITKRSNGDIWIACALTVAPTTYIYYSYSTNNGTSWTWGSYNTTANQVLALSIYPIGSDIGIIVAHAENSAPPYNTLREYRYTSSMAYIGVIGNGYNNLDSLTTVKVSDVEIYTAIRTSSGITVFYYNGSSWASTLLTTSGNDHYPSLGKDISGNVYLLWSNYVGSNSYNLTYKLHTSGGSWGSAVPITTDNLNNIWCSIQETNSNYVNFCWTRGTTTPYDILFDKLTIQATVQQTINSSATIQVTDIQHTINSDAEITHTHTQTIQSDARINAVGVQHIINSDAQIVNTHTQTIQSNANIVINWESKFIHNEDLYIVTDTVPAKIIRVDTDTIAYDSHIITGYDNSKSLAINYITHELYGSLNHGKVFEVSLFDLDTPTIFDVGQDIQLYQVSTNQTWHYTYINDIIPNSLFVIDEALNVKIDSDFRVNQVLTTIIQTIFPYLHGQQINSDFRVNDLIQSKINTDFRVNLYPYGQEQYIKREDFHVWIDGVELTNTDLILSSISITLNHANPNTATFRLARKFDDINNPNEITNQNLVQIYIKSRLEFQGKITEIECDSSTDSVTIKCEEYNHSTYNFTVKDIPITLPNTHISIYDALLSDVTINRPLPESTYSGTGKSTNNEIVYRGVQVNLGDEIIGKVRLNEGLGWLTNNGDLVFGTGTWFTANLEKLSDGSYKFTPNATYFWLVDVDLYDINTNKITHFTDKYIGTSLAPLSSDLYDLIKVDYMKQRVMENIVNPLGNYTLGSSPYKILTVKNGAFSPVPIWEDKPDGLYRTLEEGYSYTKFAKAMVDYEYRLLSRDLNFNQSGGFSGTINATASASLAFTIDAYQYYNISLLMRLNLVNTTSIGIYKNNNGFPLSVKSITISSSSMKVTTSLDNSFSPNTIEQSVYNKDTLKEPTEEQYKEVFPGFNHKQRPKYDLPSQQEIPDESTPQEEL